MRPRLLVVGPLPPPPGGVGRLVEAIVASPLAGLWEVDVFDLSKPQQEGRPSTVTAWDVAWTLVHLVTLPGRLLTRRPRVALVQSTADSGLVRDFALVLVLRAFAVPVVLHWHGAPESPAFPGADPRRGRAAFFRLVAGLCRRVVLLAEPYRPFFERHLPADRLAVVSNFVAAGTIAAARPAGADERAPGEVRLVFVGRVGPQKGTDVLLDALLLARRDHPGLVATLVGAGETPAAWAAAADHPAVRAGAARLAGPLGEERFALHGAADVFVLPTRADSFPLSVIEAMAAGLPVVASAVGAIPWLLDDGACGVLVPAGDVEALAAALGRLAGSPAERTARGAAARARQRLCFDAPRAAEDLDLVLRAASGLVPRATADRA